MAKILWGINLEWGLGLHELADRFEHEFRIEIPVDDVEDLETPGDVIDYIYSEFEAKGEEIEREEIAKKVWLTLADETGVDPKDFNEDSSFTKDMCSLEYMDL